MSNKKRFSEDWAPLSPCNCRLCRKRNGRGSELREKFRERRAEREARLGAEGFEPMSEEQRAANLDTALLYFPHLRAAATDPQR